VFKFFLETPQLKVRIKARKGYGNLLQKLQFTTPPTQQISKPEPPQRIAKYFCSATPRLEAAINQYLFEYT